jgi:Holliday junction DNA helicase RuvA
VIGTIRGVLAHRFGETIVLQTDGGVGYEVTLPLGVLERLPAVGQPCVLHTELVVREDGWALYGFDRPGDRAIFQRLLTASGFGPRLALALLSTLGPERTVRSIQARDLAALATVPGIGRKKAERLVLELHDRFGDVTPGVEPARGSVAEEAASALAALGYQAAQAEDAVRAALANGPVPDVTALIKRALHHLMTPKGGRR